MQIYINGADLITPVGNNLAANLEALRRGQTTLRLLGNVYVGTLT